MTIPSFTHNAALLVVDVQAGFDAPAWGPRNNPRAEANIAALIAAWRARRGLVVHAHHESPGQDGHFRWGTPGRKPKPEARPHAIDWVYAKSVNSAFIGTGLERDLRAIEICTLVIVGFTTNHCISTTARMAGNLGFETFVVSDATAAFDRINLDGRVSPAEEVHQAALSDLRHEFARIVDTQWLLRELAWAKEMAHA